MEKCVLCSKSDSVLQLQKVYEHGVHSLNKTINERKDGLKQVLLGQFVHHDCRKNYRENIAFNNQSERVKRKRFRIANQHLLHFINIC